MTRLLDTSDADVIGWRPERPRRDVAKPMKIIRAPEGMTALQRMELQSKAERVSMPCECFAHKVAAMDDLVAWVENYRRAA